MDVLRHSPESVSLCNLDVLLLTLETSALKNCKPTPFNPNSIAINPKPKTLNPKPQTLVMMSKTVIWSGQEWIFVGEFYPCPMMLHLCIYKTLICKQAGTKRLILKSLFVSRCTFKVTVILLKAVLK